MTAVGIAELNDLGWVQENWHGRIRFEKPIEMIVYILVYCDMEHTLHPRDSINLGIKSNYALLI